MAKPPTSPIKITAHLRDGRINSADGVIMFDSILYHAWFWKHCPEVLEGTGEREYDGYMGLPLRQLPGNRWAASRGVYEESGQAVEHLNKRPNFFNADKLDRLDMDKGIISDSVGLYRAYRMPNIIRVVDSGIITFYAVGHADKVRELLDLIPAVGKKAAAGYGIVDRWTVEDCEADYTLWHPVHGLMRPVEVGDEGELDLSGYPVFRYGICPPYWKAKNARLCHVPIAPTKKETPDAPLINAPVHTDNPALDFDAEISAAASEPLTVGELYQCPECGFQWKSADNLRCPKCGHRRKAR